MRQAGVCVCVCTSVAKRTVHALQICGMLHPSESLACSPLLQTGKNACPSPTGWADYTWQTRRIGSEASRRSGEIPFISSGGLRRITLHQVYSAKQLGTHGKPTRGFQVYRQTVMFVTCKTSIKKGPARLARMSIFPHSRVVGRPNICMCKT
jgi:hypothetical protein